MKVNLSHEEILEACKEWVERHYGFNVTGAPEILVTLNNAQTYALTRINIGFPQAPKPTGSPYRTPPEK